ncbi:MAG: hypothetical protein L3K13_01770 [Thermoplasmata archaeon]|nr:hypothetical protein [Thermoplasmata archaeon]
MPTLNATEATRFQGPALLERTAGVLTITTERNLFTHVTGVTRKREHLDLDIPLETLLSAEVERRLARHVLRLVAHGDGYTGPPQLEIDVNRPPDLQLLLGNLVAERRRQLRELKEESSRSPRLHVTIHAPPAAAPNPKVMLRCAYCRTVYPELEGKCPSCGAAF